MVRRHPGEGNRPIFRASWIRSGEIAAVPMLTLVWAREQAAGQERIRTKTLGGERWRLCSSPIPDFSLQRGFR